MGGKEGGTTETEKTQEKKEAESRGPIEKEAARAGLSKKPEAKEMTDGEGAAKAAQESWENMPTAKLKESQSGNTAIGQESIDLLTLNSVTQMELLGLKKLNVN